MPDEEMIAEIEAAVEGLEVEKEKVVAEETKAEETTTEEVVDVAEETKATEEIQEDKTGEVESREIISEATEEVLETPPAISDSLLGRAVDAGLSVADAHGFSPESLERIVREREIAWKQAYEVSIGAKEVDDSSDKDPFADFPKLDPEVHEPGVVAAFEKLTEIAKLQSGTIQDLQTHQEESLRQQEEISRAVQATSTKEVEQWFDGQVSRLGGDFTEVLGTGGYASLEPGSPQFAKREAIANLVTTLLSGYRATGQDAPPDSEVFDTAARLVLQDEYRAIHERKLTGDLENQAGQHIQRVSGQKAEGKESPVEEIARELDARYFQ